MSPKNLPPPPRLLHLPLVQKNLLNVNHGEQAKTKQVRESWLGHEIEQNANSRPNDFIGI